MDAPVNSDDAVQKAVRVLRVLVGSLAFGATTVGVLLTFAHYGPLEGKAMIGNPPKVGDVSVITLVAALVACGAAVASFVMPETLRRSTVAHVATTRPIASAEDRPALLGGWQAGGVVLAALCEGPAILCLVLFVATGDPVLLGLAGGLLVLLLTRFPSEASARRWLDQAEEELEMKRQTG